ncbi:MAG: thioredoxin family protein [Microbacterium sp.]|uniref:thioredoxin family protein n=1 Tax=Microbacterium sp. TaxID=51671 RepID=UPI0039E3B7DB
MATTHEPDVPASIRTWLAASTDPDQSERLRESFASDVEYDFDGRRRLGVDAVVAQLGTMPRGRFSETAVRLIDRGGDRYTVRFANADGAPMPSPGGPMAAMDFELGLDADGLIATISPRPRHAEPSDLQPAPAIGTPVPVFALPDTDGTATTWFDPEAAASVIVFTCNACPWALGWQERLQAVARDYAPCGVRMVQINANDPAVNAADALTVSRARVATGDFATPYLVDAGQAVARRLGARHTPDVYVVDRDRRLVYHGAPDADSERPELRAQWLRDALDDVLAGEPVRLAQTRLMGCTIKWTL